MSKPDYRVNLRDIRFRTRRAGRQISKELREAEPGQEIADLKEKIDMIYRVAFGSRGREALAHVRGWVEAKFEKSVWRAPMMEAMIYSGDFEGYRAEARLALDAYPNNLPTRAGVVRAELLVGDVAAATEAAKTLLTDTPSPRKGLPRESRLMANHLVSIGEADWLRTHHPFVASHTPQLALIDSFAPRPDPAIKTFCLNLDRDEARLRRAKAYLGPGVNFHRSPGVAGAAVPDCLFTQAGLPVTVPRKAQVGCHLSHIRAWERVRDETPEGGYSLVAEDDAVFIHGPGVGLSEAVALAQQGEYDMLFINDEPTYHLPRLEALSDLRVITIDEACASFANALRPGWGGEGYLLTARGAAQLIEFSMKFGIIAALDWQIALYAMHDIQPSKMRAPRFGGAPEGIAAARLAEPGRYFIKGGVLNMPLMLQNDLGYKTHNVEVSVGAGK